MAVVLSTLRIGMLLLNNTGSGGSERRYAQAYEHLRCRDVEVFLAINQSLLAELHRIGGLNANAPDLIVKEWGGSVARFLLRAEHDSEAGIGSIGRIIQSILSATAFGLRKLDYVIGCFSVTWWILRRRPHVLHVILGGAYVVLPLQLIRCAPPVVISVVCPSLRAMVGSVLGYRLYRMALRRAHTVDALTEPISEALKREGIFPESIRISPGSFVNTTRFAPTDIRHPWVVFVGRLIPEKNPDQFVSACALVHKCLPHVKFFILGDGPLRRHVAALVRHYGLESHVDMKWCDHAESVLQHALVFVSMQSMDNYPSQALLEAMSCGAAVVATDVGQTQKLVDDSVGKLVDAKPEAIAEAVINLLENPHHATVKGQLGRQRVMEQHSAEAYVDYLERLYRSISSEAKDGMYDA